ncbi:MAG: PKD domain-containing protein, partial [Bacteroidota bacterium]
MKKVLSLALTFSAFLCVTCREVDDLFPNQPPVAKAGENATGTAGSPVTLNASASTDPDDDALSYTWQWLSKPQGSKAIIHAFDSVMANFTPDLAGQYIIRLVVSDNIDSSADTIAIHVLKKNNGPTANAG